MLVKIQAVWRGYVQRKQYRRLLVEYKEAKIRAAKEREDEIRVLSRALSQTKELKILSPRSQGPNAQESFTNKYTISIRNDDSPSPRKTSTLVDLERRPTSTQYSQKNGEYQLASTFKQSPFHKAQFEKDTSYTPKIGKLRPFTAQ